MQPELGELFVVALASAGAAFGCVVLPLLLVLAWREGRRPRFPPPPPPQIPLPSVPNGRTVGRHGRQGKHSAGQPKASTERHYVDTLAGYVQGVV